MQKRVAKPLFFIYFLSFNFALTYFLLRKFDAIFKRSALS